MMKIDTLVAEIGSTTTVVNAFTTRDHIATFVGRGVSVTTVDSDVRDGLDGAIADLKKRFKANELSYGEMFASSSAAGGLKMTVSGLVYEMTVRAAKEAALNAGANIHLITAGPLEDDDLEQIQDIKPNIILISGGTDYGEKNVAFENLKKVEKLGLNTPILYAGNIENQYRIKKYFADSPQKPYLSLVENVYPRVDFLNIHPLRKKIYETFEEHIVHAKGMKHVKDRVDGSIMPTPGSVMEAAMLLYEELGNLVVIDVGGATTDVHSVTLPSDEYLKYSEGEAKEKRTVEGDLGVFVNREKVLEYADKTHVRDKLQLDEESFDKLLRNYEQIPKTETERRFVYELTKVCVYKSLDRHVGDMRNVYTTNGMKVIPEGRDLTQVQTVVLTGGALIHLEDTESIIADYMRDKTKKLVPKGNIKILRDWDYIMSSVGVLSLKYPDKALDLLMKSLRIESDAHVSANRN